jgi:hypothetical protein
MADDTALTTTTRPGSIYAGMEAFDNAQRIAKSLASSTLVPQQFQGQQGYANCLVALEIAGRMNLSPLQVMQNLHIIHGRPSWSSQFIIALINGCGRFEPLQYRVTGKGDDLACQCVAKEISSEAELEGPTVTMAMAKAEGWATKSGSKWRTMPDLMIRYRAAAMWGRLYIPDLLVGISYSQEEVMDIEPITVEDAPQPEPAAAQPADEIF